MNKSFKKILIILGHPNTDSFCNSLAENYLKGAIENKKAEVKILKLGELDFDPILHKGYKEIQILEPDLKKAQELMSWAEHLVFVYPVWWGTMPALMKGFIDRVILPGYAFKYKKDSPMWLKLWQNKTAHLIVAKDSPEAFYKFYFKAPGYKMMKYAFLKFCGVRKIKITGIGSVKNLDEKNKKKWLEKIKKFGLNLL